MRWNEHEPLSTAGEQRRNEIRGAVSRELIRVAARRRRLRRGAAATGLALVIGVSAWLAMKPWQHQQQSARQSMAQGENDEAPINLVQISVFESNPGLDQVARSDVRVDPSSVGMSDDELLQTLSELGRPTGLAFVEGRAVLTSPVTDEEQEASPQFPESIERSG